jgi:hypothetical protein
VIEALLWTVVMSERLFVSSLAQPLTVVMSELVFLFVSSSASHRRNRASRPIAGAAQGKSN